MAATPPSPLPTDKFSGKVAIVTGASSGLGEALAIRLALEGACVTLTGRDERRLEAAAKKCRDAAALAAKVAKAGKTGEPDGKITTVVGEVTSSQTRQELVDKTIKIFGQVDILVNNAGIFPVEDGLDHCTEESFDQLFDVNVKSVFFLTKLAVPHLEKTKGNVLFVSSTLSEAAMPSHCVYNATKAAMDCLMRNLSIVLGPRGVRMNCINPTYIPTRAVRGMAATEDKIEEVAQGLAAVLGPRHPLGRSPTPQEFVEVAMFLISPHASYVSGHALMLDGGAKHCGIFSQ